jgi:hypothetical protein
MIDTIADDDRNDRVTILTTPQSSRIRHCEGGAANEAIEIRGADSGLARYARNDGHESRRFADPPNLRSASVAVGAPLLLLLHGPEKVLEAPIAPSSRFIGLDQAASKAASH